jgi:glutamate carboxypeptidase
MFPARRQRKPPPLIPRTDPGPAEAMLQELRAWVEIETPTTDPAAVNRLVDRALAGLEAAGARTARIAGCGGFGDALVARIGADTGRRILIAGHLDTVWGSGTLAAMPFRIEGERAYGPGIYDMKAGSFMAWHAVICLLRQKVPTALPITLLLTPDEEVGSPTSRALIEDAAREAAFVLIPEPAAGAEGAAVTARKGVGRYTVGITGVSAHAGGNFAEGASAVLELARQVQAVAAMTDPARGITTNCAPVWGGTRPNVIPAEAGFEIDFRCATMTDGEAMHARLMGLKPHDPRCTVTVTGAINRPPFDESPGGLALYERARAIAKDIGFDLPKRHRGGASDGNFTAGLGVPTLDGLGCVGAGAHAPHEHIVWPGLAQRSRLILGLLETLQ